MQRFIRLYLIATTLAALSLIGCRPIGPVLAEHRALADGTYRGAFIDEGIIQVNVQFSLQDGVVTTASFRHLVGALPAYNLDTEEEPQRSVVAQYEEALQYLIGKPLGDHLAELYRPENVILSDVDGYTRATVRANKIVSAIRDALNRGPYEL